MMTEDGEVVISGIAGRYPDCDTFNEFADALLKGVDLVTVDDRRYPPGTFGLPHRTGKINGVDRFDSAVFGISQKLVDFMDPRQRILLETTYEAIMDAGYNPDELRGSNTGVYVAISQMDSIQQYRDRTEHTKGYVILGSTLSQAANRISYKFDFKGPSYILDTACSAAMYGMVHAINDIESGKTDSAIVAGVQLNFHPFEAREFFRLNMLSKDGKCKVFNTDRDGYARSEAIISIFLQRKTDCRRIYATVLGAKTNSDGYKKEGITFPSVECQTQLMKEVYAQRNVDPSKVTFSEMHGTGTPAGDQVECQSMINHFCGADRTEPLLVGAVKSNMGHSEISSGLCSISKVITAMEKGVIPANLHCENLDYTLPGIGDNQLKVVTENVNWPGGIVGVNCFGFGGSNSHIILKSNEKFKKPPPKKLTHRLVNVSGRTEESVKYLLDAVKNNQYDDEFLALIDQIYKKELDSNYERGYTILGENPITEITKISKMNRPIWFIYAGMGSQWTGMGKDLMKIGVFRNTFRRCATVLKPFNIDLEEIVLSDDPSVFDDISNCFAAISATEIALTDVLKSLGIEPDGMAGHSLGEVGCAYANGDLTAEEATLIGYARGYATVRSTSIPGQMAAVGLSREECERILPDGIYIACVNGRRSVTVTGPEKLVHIFVERLSEHGVFAKQVKTAGYAFHSKYLDSAAPILLDFIKNIIKDPKPRSKKWISSSWPDTEWDQPHTQYNSAEYHCHNFQNPVLFEQVYKYIPKDAIVVEVAPHGLLLSVLKKELGQETTALCLVNRTVKDNLQFFLSSIGRIYINGGQTDLTRFYNDVSFPVSRGTPNIGSLIKWDHSIKWYAPYFQHKDSFGKIFKVNLDEEFLFIQGHNIDGRVLMPATGYLELVWQLMAELLQKHMLKLPVVFENVQFLRATVIPEKQEVKFLVNIMKLSGNFEVFEGGSVVCRGKISTPKNILQEFINPTVPSVTKNGQLTLHMEDVYKLFRLNRYLYEDLFRGISEINIDGTIGKLKWYKSFTAFLDAMLQVTLVTQESSELLLPTKIQKLVIDPLAHIDQVDKENNEIMVYFDKNLNMVKSGGVEIIDMEISKAPKRQQTYSNLILEQNIFVPYYSESQNEIDIGQTLKIILQIILENNNALKQIKMAEIVEREDHKLFKYFKELAAEEPLVTVDLINPSPKYDYQLDLISISQPNQIVSDLLNMLREDGFILYHGSKELISSNYGLVKVYENVFKSKGFFLLRKTQKVTSYSALNVHNKDFTWIEDLKQLLKEKDIVYLISQNDDISGIMGFVKCLDLEPKENCSVKCVFIKDKQADTFSIDSELYKNQLDMKLTFNVLSKGVWGSYRHLTVHPMQHIPVKHATNIIQTLGDLSTLSWVERPQTYFRLFPGGELAYVFFSALNFRDVMIAAGKVLAIKQCDPTIPEQAAGLEFSGITESGKRVMGMLSGLGVGLQVMTDPLFTWEIPTNWSLEDAATVPTVYATVYYALIMRGQLQPRESILIHAGTGGVGIAAISIALHMNCTVYTTVGTTEKREFIKEMFPRIKDEHIGNSRNATFEQMIKRNTNGKGVDMVLNSLSSELFQASIRCLGRRGRFLEIGKVDLEAGTPINANVFAKNTSFHGILLDDFFDNTSETKKQLNELVLTGIAKGVVKPLPRKVFKENKVEDAYRYLSTGKHKGKVLIQIRSENSEAMDIPTRTILALPKIYFDLKKIYILVGGLGGFGLALVDFMIKRNAKKFILNSRNGVTNGYQSLCLHKWNNSKGIKVIINKDDTSTVSGAKQLLNFAQQFGPIGGIFNMALVLDDGLFVNQTPEKFENVFKSKIRSGVNLDEISRTECASLDHFVVFSSIACGRGNMGQTNYGMANSSLERLCEKRREDGLPALAIQWGPVGDVGYIANNEKFEKQLAILGLVPQSIVCCMDVLETFMLHPCTVAATHILAETLSVNNIVQSGKSPAETVAHILGIKNMGSVNDGQTLAELGLDSLMTSEIKQTLYRNYNIEISPEEIRDLTFGTIKTFAGKDSNLINISQDTPATSQFVESANIVSLISPILPKELMLEFNKNANKSVFLIHPIEGHIECMKPLAYKLNANVYGLQCTKEIECDHIKDFATYFVNVIKNVQPQGPYYMVGYSYGAALAFEMAVQMEKIEEHVELCCIDGSPAFVQLILEGMYEKNNKSEHVSRLNILRKFTEYFEKVDPEEAMSLLLESLSWESQLKVLAEHIAKNTGYNCEEIELAADRFFRRVRAGYFYAPSDIFTGKIVLLKSTDVYFNISNDYELQRICKNSITVHEYKGTHTQILLGDNLNQISETINELLV